MADLSPVLSVARDILSAAKKPLHVDEIAAEAVRTNRNLQLSAEDFSAKVAAALAANLRTKSPSFGKVKNKTGGLKRGVYRVRSTRGKTELPPPAR